MIPFMSSPAIEHDDHPVAAAVTRIHAELDALVDTGVWSLRPTELATTLPALTRAKARLAELELRVAHHAARAGLGSEVGAADTTAWWATTTHMTKPEAHRLARLADALDAAHEPVRDAMAAGNLLLDQAQVIVDAVDALPANLVDPEVTAQAETHLIGLAADHDAKALRILGRRILDVVAPQISEHHQRQVLAREEEHARQAARLTLLDDGHGRCHGRFTLPSLHGTMLKKALLAIAAPKHQAATQAATRTSGNPQSDVDAGGDTGPFGGRVAAPLRMGQAFMEYLETYPTDRLPHAGGLDAVVVTMDLDTLLGGLKPASIDLGGTISAAEARRLACEAAIIPVVLGGKSEILDVGRKRRFHTKAQRHAMAVRDKGCTAQGCDWPPGMCHAHHNLPWHQGGDTSIHNGRLLCPRHHSYAHHPKYQMNDTRNGKVSFHRIT
jgi:hypothetical protein